MNKKLTIASISTILFVFPLLASAVNTVGLNAVPNALIAAISIFLWPLFIGFAIIMFIISGYHFLIGDASTGRKNLIAGIIGVAVGMMAFSLPIIIGGLLGTGI